MSAVHLNVMELERDGDRGFQPTFAVTAPHHHRIAEQVGILIDDAVEFGGRHRRCAYHHCIIYEGTFAGRAGRLRQSYIVGTELIQVIGIGNVA